MSREDYIDRCQRCGKPIAGQMVRIGQALWHPACVRNELGRMQEHALKQAKGQDDAAKL